MALRGNVVVVFPIDRPVVPIPPPHENALPEPPNNEEAMPRNVPRLPNVAGVGIRSWMLPNDSVRQVTMTRSKKIPTKTRRKKKKKNRSMPPVDPNGRDALVEIPLPMVGVLVLAVDRACVALERIEQIEIEVLPSYPQTMLPPNHPTIVVVWKDPVDCDEHEPQI